MSKIGKPITDYIPASAEVISESTETDDLSRHGVVDERGRSIGLAVRKETQFDTDGDGEADVIVRESRFDTGSESTFVVLQDDEGRRGEYLHDVNHDGLIDRASVSEKTEAKSVFRTMLDTDFDGNANREEIAHSTAETNGEGQVSYRPEKRIIREDTDLDGRFDRQSTRTGGALGFGRQGEAVIEAIDIPVDREE